MLLHIKVIQFDIDSQKSSYWHSLTPATRLICLGLMIFATAFTPHGNWWTWAIYSLGIFILVLISNITFLELVKRVAVESAFVSLILLGTLFHKGGQVVWHWGTLQITTGGLTVLGSVGIKVILSLLMLNILILTTSIPALLNALIILKMPPILVAIMASMYRYMSVLIAESQTMYRAAKSRNLMLKNQATRLIIGNMLGLLFIRTYERGERIYLAMLARGYQGLFPVVSRPKPQKMDIVAVTFTVVLGITGQIIYLIM